MTTYSTGNPVGSPDPRDLYDNAENLDEAINSTSDEWTDRLGRTRFTIEGVTNLATDLGTAAYRDTVGLGDVYAREGILGTVSQSGGTPTGAIIERGSNSNGDYVKFADGTLIMSGIYQITDLPSTGGGSSGVAITYPTAKADSSSSPAPQITPYNLTGLWSSSDDRGRFIFTSRSSSTTSFFVVYFATEGANPTGGNGAISWSILTTWY